MAWTSPRTWVSGEVVTAALLNAHLRDNLNALGAWADYTPVWSATGTAPALGDGTLAGQYARVGKLVGVQIQFSYGTTSTPGTGAWGFSVPSTAAVARGVGAAWILDTGTQSYVGVLQLATTTIVRVINHGNVGAGVGVGVPFTWAAGDTISLSGQYSEA